MLCKRLYLISKDFPGFDRNGFFKWCKAIFDNLNEVIASLYIFNDAGSVTVLPGATISPGSTGPGMLLLSGALGLSGTVQLELNKGTVPSNDVIRAFGALIYGGALVVSNLSAAAYVVGDKFRCFYAGSYGGAFTSLSLPPLGPGLGWDPSRLLVDGSLVVAVAPTVAITSPTVTTVNIPSGVGLVLGASASSTHNPNGLTFAWSQLGGPGPVTFDGANSTNATALFPAVGTYTLSFTASDGAVQATTNLMVNVGFVPVAATGTNVGTVPASAGVVQSNGVFTIAAGGAGIQSASANDDFYFVQQPAAGNVEIVARIRSVANIVSASSRGGVMVRETLSRDAREVFMGLTPTGAGRFVWRSTPGGSGGSSASANSTLALPYWVRLTRVGNVITAYAAPDLGNGPGTWAQQGVPQTIAMSNAVWVGLAAASGSATLTGAVVADTLTITPALLNVGPWVSAGPDQTNSELSLVLAGGVSDDGAPVPPGVTTVAWAKFSGPGDVSFAPANATNATATFAGLGTYVLRLTADDGQVRTFDDATLTLTNPTPVLPNPPQMGGFSAGADGLFHFQLSSSDPASYTVMVSTNLQDWALLGPADLTTNGWFQFTDPAVSNAPQRFYRLRWP